MHSKQGFLIEFYSFIPSIKSNLRTKWNFNNNYEGSHGKIENSQQQ